MKKVCKRFFVFFFVFVMIFTAGGMSELSVVYAEGEAGTEADTDAKKIETTEETKKETADNKETGGITTTTTTNKKWSGVDEEGAQVEGQESRIDIVVSDEKGGTVKTSGSFQGEENTVKKDSTVTESSEDISSSSDSETSDPECVSSETKQEESERVTGSTTEEISEEDGYGVAGAVTINLEPGDTDKRATANTDEIKVAEKILGSFPEEGTTETENPDGTKTITKVTYTKDQDGNIIGYHTTVTVVTTSNSNESESSASKVISEDREEGETTTDVKTSVEIILPQKPASGKSVNADGSVTTVKVTDLLDDKGTVVGYHTTTIITDKNGKEISKTTESIWGVKTIQTTTKVTPVTTTTVSEKTITETTTEVITEAVTSEDVTVTATDREIKASMGTILSQNVITNYNNLNVTQQMPELRKVDLTTELYHRPDSNKKTEYDPNGTIYQWLGEYGIESIIRIKAGEGTYSDTYQPHQFILRDKDNGAYYVYCADFDTSPVEGADYDMTRLEDADYYDNAAAEQIRAIALKGYWGTASGTGSMDAFQTLLLNSRLFTQDEINSLTPGMAVSATQAAIWYYGNSGQDKLSATDVVGKYYDPSKDVDDWSDTPEKKKDLVNRIYQYLIGMEGEQATADNTLITEDNFAQRVVLTVKDKLTDGSGKYNTDLSFAMAVIPGDNDDLTVSILDSGGNTIASQKITSENATPDTEKGDYIYTFSNLQLANNTNLTLKLSGTQNLREGVYLFTETTGQNASQTFVGVGESSQKVDLQVALRFALTEATANLKKDTAAYTKTTTATKVYESTETTTLRKLSKETSVTTDTTETMFRQWSGTYLNDYSKNKNYKSDGSDTSAGSVETGDQTPVFYGMILFILSLGVIAFELRRRTIKD